MASILFLSVFSLSFPVQLNAVSFTHVSSGQPFCPIGECEPGGDHVFAVSFTQTVLAHGSHFVPQESVDLGEIVFLHFVFHFMSTRQPFCPTKECGPGGDHVLTLSLSLA